MRESVESFKVVLVGESGVGKRDIINKYINLTFQEDQQSTMGGIFATKSILKFEIWDTSGQERYRSLTRMFCKEANAAILVNDITRRDSFEEIQTYWAEEIKKNAPQNIILVVAANKSELIEQEVVDEE